MRQPQQRLVGRRTHAHEAGTFTFWFRRPHSVKQVGAWMLKRDERQAAFLTPARHAPRLGERLELSKPDASGLISTEQHPGAERLPRFGRVVEVQQAQGVVQRVAIRFEGTWCAPEPSSDTRTGTV